MYYVLNITQRETPLLPPSTLVSNRSASAVRKRMLEGREHWVVEMVMLVEGTHAGSEGPVMYPGHVLKNSVQLWNGKPIVVSHSPSYANEPSVYSRQKIGTVFNTRYDQLKRQLIAQAWIDPERAKAVDERVYQAVLNGQTLEVSTGVVVVPSATDRMVAVALVPDHLAVLPDHIGACSINDGCGLARNTMGETPLLPYPTL